MKYKENRIREIKFDIETNLELDATLSISSEFAGHWLAGSGPFRPHCADSGRVALTPNQLANIPAPLQAPLQSARAVHCTSRSRPRGTGQGSQSAPYRQPSPMCSSQATLALASRRCSQSQFCNGSPNPRGCRRLRCDSRLLPTPLVAGHTRLAAVQPTPSSPLKWYSKDIIHLWHSCFSKSGPSKSIRREAWKSQQCQTKKPAFQYSTLNLQNQRKFGRNFRETAKKKLC